MTASDSPSTIIALCRKATQRRLQPRKTLEIIIDTCSHRPEQLHAIQRMISYVQQADPRIYEQIRIVIPCRSAPNFASEPYSLIF